MIIYYSLAAIYSLCIGSFLNVVIYRLPLMLQRQAIQDCEALLNRRDRKEEASINLFLPRSFCPQCKTPIKAWQNIPLLSYFLLKGHCRVCQASISWTYPCVEMSSVLLALACLYLYGFSLTGLFAIVFIFFLIPLFFIDCKHQLLPDCLTLSLLWLGLLANSFSLFTTLQDAVLSSMGAYLFLWIFIKGYYLIRGKIGMGNGDFKLFAALAAWFGFLALPFILVFSSFVAAFLGLLYLKGKGKALDTAIPFGPFLCLSGLICLFGRSYIFSFF